MAKRIEGNYAGVSFKEMDVSKTTLDGNFTGADFTDANLKGTDFSRSTLQDADLSKTDTSDADTSKCTLLNTLFAKDRR